MAIIVSTGYATTRPDYPWYLTQFMSCPACLCQFCLEPKDLVKRSGSSIFWGVIDATHVNGNCPWCGYANITQVDDGNTPAGNIVNAWTYADGQGFVGVVLVDVHNTDGGWLSRVVGLGVDAHQHTIQAQFADPTLAWAIQGVGQPTEHLLPGYAFLLAQPHTPLDRAGATLLDPNIIRIMDREGIAIF